MNRQIANILFLCMGLLLSRNNYPHDIFVTDDSGQAITLPHPAQRIISLSPAITEMLFRLGAQKQITGVVSFSDYPLEAKKIRRVGDYHALDIETILSLKPDLVLAWQSGNPAPQIALLQSLGLQVYQSEPQNFSDIAHTLQDFGQLSGHANTAKIQAQQFLHTIAQIRRQYRSKSPVKVLIQIWHHPIMAIGQEHIINQMIQACGGVNIVHVNKPAVEINLESVIQLAPQIIISTQDSAQAQTTLQQQWQAWKTIPAVHNQQLYTTPADVLVRHTLRLAQGLRNLCRLINKARKKTIPKKIK